VLFLYIPRNYQTMELKVIAYFYKVGFQTFDFFVSR